MGNEKNEMYIESPDRIDVQHAMHARATGKPSQAGVAENLGAAASNQFRTMETTPIQVHDTTLSWGGGQPVAPAGLGDTTEFPIQASAVYPKVVKATEPRDFGQPPTPVANHRAGCSGVDEIAAATEIRGERR
jgi:hypothetical protein